MYTFRNVNAFVLKNGWENSLFTVTLGNWNQKVLMYLRISVKYCLVTWLEIGFEEKKIERFMVKIKKVERSWKEDVSEKAWQTGSNNSYVNYKKNEEQKFPLRKCF